MLNVELARKYRYSGHKTTVHKRKDSSQSFFEPFLMEILFFEVLLEGDQYTGPITTEIQVVPNNNF